MLEAMLTFAQPGRRFLSGKIKKGNISIHSQYFLSLSVTEISMDDGSPFRCMDARHSWHMQQHCFKACYLALGACVHDVRESVLLFYES